MNQFFPSFFGRRKLARDTGNVYQQSIPLDLGEIIQVYPRNSFRVDVRLFSNGKILENVRIPGPFYNEEGKLHGLKPLFVQNQLVLIGYIHGRAEAPLIIQGFSFSSGDINQDNVEQLESYDPDAPEIGHQSGHRIAYEQDKQTVYDKDGNAVFIIDLATKEISIADGWKLKAGNVTLQQDGIEIEQGNISIQQGDVTVQQAVKPVSLSQHTHPVMGDITGMPN